MSDSSFWMLVLYFLLWKSIHGVGKVIIIRDHATCYFACSKLVMSKLCSNATI